MINRREALGCIVGSALIPSLGFGSSIENSIYNKIPKNAKITEFYFDKTILYHPYYKYDLYSYAHFRDIDQLDEEFGWVYCIRVYKDFKSVKKELDSMMQSKDWENRNKYKLFVTVLFVEDKISGISMSYKDSVLDSYTEKYLKEIRCVQN